MDKEWKKIVEIEAIAEMHESMDLNEAAEMLDYFESDENPATETISIPQKRSNTFQYAIYSMAAIFVVGFLSLLMFYPFAQEELIAEEEVTEEWILPPGLNEYDLGMNTVDYLEEMMPKIEDEEAQERIESIRDRLLQVVRLRDGVDEIQIDLVDYEEVGAWALPGGFIVFTKSFYDLCESDDELAVVLAHEIGHIVEGHVNNPMESRLQGEYQRALENLGLESGAAFTEEFSNATSEKFVNMITKQKELDADKQGILYCVLAGYDANAAFSIIDKAVESGEGIDHPSKELRIEKLHERLGNFVDESEKFHAGVFYFLRGELDLAEQAFRGFLQTFPSREVYNNLGVINYLKALQKLPLSEITTAKTLQIDMHTLADDLVLRGGGIEKFKRYLSKAERRFKEAIDRDPKYAIAQYNLGCVYDDIGKYDFARFHLNQAQKLGFDKNQCQNGIASVLIHENKLAEAKAILKEISDLPEANFNLGMIELVAGQDPKSYFRLYLSEKQNSGSIFAEYAKQHADSEILESQFSKAIECKEVGFKIDDSKEDVVASLGEPEKEVIILDYNDITVWRFPEKSIKVYFVGDYVESFIISDVAFCTDLRDIKSQKGICLNKALPEYFIERGNLMGFVDGKLDIWGKYAQ